MMKLLNYLLNKENKNYAKKLSSKKRFMAR